MLSIISACADANMAAQLKENIGQTCGVVHECIFLDNTLNPDPIAAIYNRGAAASGYPMLLFLHQDVHFHKSGWGNIVVNLLSKQKIGLIGVSGSPYKSKQPGSWSMIPEDYYRIHAIQRFEDGRRKHFNTFGDREEYAEVAVIDGCFMATRTECWEACRFDERRVKGFHMYDCDFSRKVGTRWRIAVANGICMEHYSPGTFDRNWINETLSWHRENRKSLPLKTNGLHLSKPEKRTLDHFSCASFLIVCIRQKVGFSLAVKYFISCLSIKPFAGKNILLFRLLVSSLLNRLRTN